MRETFRQILVSGVVMILSLVAVAVVKLRAPRAVAGPDARSRPSTAIDPAAEPQPEPARVTFAVLSDLHTPNDGAVAPPIGQVVDAMLALRPRFVVITGDFTNGAETDGAYRQDRAELWYDAVRIALAPLDAAGIPVFPIAGNHDSYEDGHRRRFAAAWADLAARATPFAIQSRAPGDAPYRIDAAPFSYSIDVDGVHLAFAHVVDQHLAPEVAAWLDEDLAAASARGSHASLVFGHVPAVSIMTPPFAPFARQVGDLLARHHVAAYVAGHEHLVWDETHDLGTSRLRQIVVGCSSGAYVFPPSEASRRRARCRGQGQGFTCSMPETGQRFRLRPGTRGPVQRQRQTFTMIDVDPDGSVRARPYALERDGRVVDWGDPAPPPVAFARGAGAALRP
jgi:hypothetical protein